MPLFIKNPEVDQLTDELMALRGNATKVEAVRDALKAEIDRIRQAKSLRNRLSPSLRRASELGPLPAGNHAQETDEFWGEA